VSAPNPAYAVHEIQTSTLTVREYVDQNGRVFAVTWKGVHHPDLKNLLGDYHEPFRSTDASTPRRFGGRKHLEVHSSDQDLTVVRSGHMRSLGGKAVVKSLLPEGVTAESLP
jgi:hypothetical protein